MKRDAFDTPVKVYRGVGSVLEINGVCEALAFLDTWPLNDTFNSRIAAHQACLHALDSSAGAEGEQHRRAARSAFVTFASSAGILVADVDPAVSAGAIREPQAGLVA